MKKTTVAAALLIMTLFCSCAGKGSDVSAPSSGSGMYESHISAPPVSQPEQDKAGPESAYDDDAAREDCEKTAALYADRLSDSSGEFYGINLSDDELREIADVLGQAGLTATDVGRLGEMTNPSAVDEFFAAFTSGESARVCIYELCCDGGFIRHELESIAGVQSVRISRLAWQMGRASVTYSEKFSLTALDYSNGTLYYEYYMPDNPVGTNHDGHVDTSESFVVKRAG